MKRIAVVSAAVLACLFVTPATPANADIGIIPGGATVASCDRTDLDSALATLESVNQAVARYADAYRAAAAEAQARRDRAEKWKMQAERRLEKIVALRRQLAAARR